jgi:AGCS family alanine or glycine:cation symporter
MAMSSVLGSRPSAVMLALCLALFALSTMLSWGLYGSRCCEYLLGPRATRPYQLVFTLLIFGAVTIDVADVWNLADALNGFMAIPNLVSVLALSGLVVRTTKEYLQKHS